MNSKPQFSSQWNPQTFKRRCLRLTVLVLWTFEKWQVDRLYIIKHFYRCIWQLIGLVCCTAVDSSGPLTLFAVCCQTSAEICFVVCCLSGTVFPLGNICVCMKTECQYVPAPGGVVTKLRAWHQRNRNSVAGRGKRFLSSPKLLDELSDQARLPFIWHGGLFA